MKFEEIFKKDGLYVADGFAEGAAFRIKDGTLTIVTHKNEHDLVPMVDNYPVHKSLFEKDYRVVLTRQSLFKKTNEEVKIDCKDCVNNGQQSINPSECTGCFDSDASGAEIFKNFKRKE